MPGAVSLAMTTFISASRPSRCCTSACSARLSAAAAIPIDRGVGALSAQRQRRCRTALCRRAEPRSNTACACLTSDRAHDFAAATRLAGARGRGAAERSGPGVHCWSGDGRGQRAPRLPRSTGLLEGVSADAEAGAHAHRATNRPSASPRASQRAAQHDCAQLQHTATRHNAQGLSFSDCSNPKSFRQDPRFGWGFFGHRWQLYSAAVPHAGYDIMKAWGAAAQRGHFVFTSNVDGALYERDLPSAPAPRRWRQCLQS